MLDATPRWGVAVVQKTLGRRLMAKAPASASAPSSAPPSRLEEGAAGTRSSDGSRERA